MDQLTVLLVALALLNAAITGKCQFNLTHYTFHYTFHYNFITISLQFHSTQMGHVRPRSGGKIEALCQWIATG